MKNLKVAILLCGLVGLAEMVLPFRGASMLKLLFELDKVQGVLYAAIFVVPVIMGAMALARPPMLGWQAGVALAAFVIGVVKFRIWGMSFGAAGIHDILLTASIVVGAVVSIVALLKPEAGV